LTIFSKGLTLKKAKFFCSLTKKGRPKMDEQKGVEHRSSLVPDNSGPDSFDFVGPILNHPARFAFAVAGIMLAMVLAAMVLGAFYEAVKGVPL